MTQKMNETEIQALLSIMDAPSEEKEETPVSKRYAVRMFGEEIVTPVVEALGEKGLTLELLNQEAEWKVNRKLYVRDKEVA
jgi:hypothetical protein